MWRESPHAGCSVRASASSTSPRLRRLFSSRCSTTSAGTGSRGGRKRTLHGICASLVSGSTTHRHGCAIGGYSSSTSQDVRGGRRAIGSETRAMFNLSSQTTSAPPQTCQVCGASRTSSTCRPTWLEGKETYAGRSSEFQSSQRSIGAIGQLAARCPSGEEAQGEGASGVAHGLARSRGRWPMRERW